MLVWQCAPVAETEFLTRQRSRSRRWPVHLALKWLWTEPKISKRKIKVTNTNNGHWRNKWGLFYIFSTLGRMQQSNKKTNENVFKILFGPLQQWPPWFGNNLLQASRSVCCSEFLICFHPSIGHHIVIDNSPSTVNVPVSDYTPSDTLCVSPIQIESK